MSTVLSTIANALIEFILSLLRDPALAEQFDTDPEGTLAANGMQNVSYDDLCAVLPMVYDHPQVMQTALPAAAAVSPSPGGVGDVVRELRNVVTSNSYVTNNSTLVDQSVNQNIWAGGDVMQLFDNEAVLATGADSTAAGRDVVVDHSSDSSTSIVAGGDAVVDNQVAVTTAQDSYNQSSDASTTDNSTTTTLTDVQAAADLTGAPTSAAPATTDATPQPVEPDPIASVDTEPDPALTPEPEPVEDVYVDDEY